MAGFHDEQFLREIEERIDITDVVSETVSLTRKGNRYWGLCPFHQEKTPSFTVTPEKNMFYCFGCHTGGNMFTFLMKRDGIEFKEAVAVLAERAGLQITVARPDKREYKRKKVREMNLAAAQFYHQMLGSQAGRGALRYLRERGINREIQDKFCLGFAPDEWTVLYDYLIKKGYDAEIIKESGLIHRNNNRNSFYDLFRNRLIFPIYSYSGEVLGFGGRCLDQSIPKYINTAETELYSKRHHLYGLFQARQAIRNSNEVLLVEGYMDCLKLQQYAIDNAVASLGTAFTREQGMLLRRYCEKAVIIYDGDEAGQRETLRAINILREEGLKVEVLVLPEGNDPDDFVERHGKEEFLQYIKNNKVNDIEFKINRYINDEKELNLEASIRVINAVKKDITNCGNELEKDYYVKRLSNKLKIEENLVHKEIRRHYSHNNRVEKNKTTINRDNIQYGNYTLEEQVLAEMLGNMVIFNNVNSHIGLEWCSDKAYSRILQIYKELSRTGESGWPAFQQAVYRENMEDVLARLTMIMEDAPRLDEIRIQGFINNMRSRAWKNKVKAMQERLATLKGEGNFYNVLNFILSVDKIVNHAREGGIQ